MNAAKCDRTICMACACSAREKERPSFDVAYQRMLRRDRAKTILWGLLVLGVMLLSCAGPLAYLALSAA